MPSIAPLPPTSKTCVAPLSDWRELEEDVWNGILDSLDQQELSRLSRQIEWPELVVLEPRLLQVEQLAKRGGDAHGWEEVKLHINALVGWNASDRRFHGCNFYDTAYRHCLRQFERNGGRF